MLDILYPLRRLHGAMYEAKLRQEKRNQYKQQFKNHPKTVFLVLTPEHGNMGDHAIAEAETELLRSIGCDYIEITGQQLYKMRKRKELNLMDGFPILINGGGNLGTLWMDVEQMERNVIEQNPRSKIFILPNTIYFEDSEWGKEELEKSKRIYNRHNNLYLYAREKESYLLMKDTFRHAKLIPDMVLYLNLCRGETERHGCLLCLRNDREKTRTEEQEKMVFQQAAELFGEAVEVTDMVVAGSVPPERREQMLEEKFDQFRHAELVITDRLHGMIFCAITGTPCVVVDSKSPKVRGCYEWIKDLDYIRFADAPSRIGEEYRKIPSEVHFYDNNRLMPYYEELKTDILNMVLEGR